MRGQRFSSGQNIESWAVISFADPRDSREYDKAQDIAFNLKKISRTYGLEFRRDPVVRLIHYDDLEKTLKSFKVEPRVDFCLCLLPRDQRLSDGLYKQIKQLSDKELGIVTQCAQMTKIQSTKPAYLANLCLKVRFLIVVG